MTAGLVDQFQTRITLEALERAYDRARDDLWDVGLLADGRYLDRIPYYLTWVPTFRDELGFVFDEELWWGHKMLGFEPGAIYVPPNAPAQKHVPGGTLLDTVRHEFGHAWAWLDRSYFRQAWFRAAFGARYWDAWDAPPAPDPRHFVSNYATESPAEDFCETFMFYLKYRRSLRRFAHRRGVYRKLRAVERAVKVAARERAPRVRGPRR
jgi:hypothetical protein